MHRLQLMHQDIKPENILFSPSLNRLVFIDFGLSRLVKETQGATSLSNFSGSYNYCSPEMKKCFAEKKSRQVDLYYNDLYALEGTIQDIQVKFNKLEDDDEE